jgi:hypothetical protein
MAYTRQSWIRLCSKRQSEPQNRKLCARHCELYSTHPHPPFNSLLRPAAATPRTETQANPMRVGRAEERAEEEEDRYAVSDLKRNRLSGGLHTQCRATAQGRSGVSYHREAKGDGGVVCAGVWQWIRRRRHLNHARSDATPEPTRLASATRPALLSFSDERVAGEGRAHTEWANV